MAFTEIDEKLLVRAYQAGDERAFDTIVRTQYNALYAHALRRLSSHESAEDAVQDTLLRAYRAMPNLDGDLALRAWLHRILTNVCHDEGNRRRRQQGLVEKVGALPEELADDPIEEAILHDTVRVMSEALQGLPESYREALVLRYVDGLSFREVAEVAGTTEENARARVHRGRRALHKVMARLALIAAFVIPGLKRTQEATAADQTAAPDHVSLVTQLTAHGVNAAPTVGRLAEVASASGGGKSALATAAVAAVAAVGVTGGAVAVNEARRPERPPAQVAGPAEPAPSTSSDAPVGAAGTNDVEGAGQTPADDGETDPNTTSPSSTTTTETLPRSAVAPFEPTDDVEVSTTTTSTSTTTTTTVPGGAAGATIEGSVSSETLEVRGEGPNADVSGAITVVGRHTSGGTLEGRVTLHDDGFAGAELVLTVDGRSHELSYRGNVVGRVEDGGATVWHLAGQYRLQDGESLGLAELGELTGSFRRNGDDGTLRLSLSGEARDGQAAGHGSTPDDGDDDS